MKKEQEIINYIIDWLKEQLSESKQKGYVVGVSGGIDSAVVSTLCAKTKAPVIVLNMPISQAKDQFNRASEHINWLKNNNSNVSDYTIDLTNCFQTLCDALPENAKEELALVNSRSRLRMMALYAFANSNNALVCGTGNKIEDFGIGFFTKYGDGGVDISPIADLMKSEVYQIGRKLGIIDSILSAAPTDGLWGTDRTDEDQIGASYDELEWAMDFCHKNGLNPHQEITRPLTAREKRVLEIYINRHKTNQHKMNLPPVCKIPNK